MSTATATPIDLGRMIPVESEFIRFEEIGTQVEGFFIGRESNGGLVQLTFETKSGDLFKLNEVADLKEKVRDIWRDHYFILTYQGKDQSVGTEKGNAMMRFKVARSENPRKVKQKLSRAPGED